MVNIQENPRPGCDDRISQLPNDILCLILSFFNVKEGVRMRLLSRRWKGLSPSTSKLRLDLLSFLGIDINRCCPDYREKVLTHKSKFLTAVTQLLKLYSGPKLDRFEVSFPLEDDSASDVDGWITFALEQAAKVLDIDLRPCSKGAECYYTFPFHLLPDGKTSPLKHLSLRVCALSCVPDYAVKFHSLVTLYIGYTRINQVSLDSMLSGCVNLEFLRIQQCYVPETCRITNALRRLKRLIIEDCLDHSHIELNSLPELTAFEYMGPVRKFTFCSLPSLEKMYFRFLNYATTGTRYIFGKLAEDFSHLQTLSLLFVPFQEPPTPACITPFKYLKDLELFIWVSRNYDLLTIVRILNASPVLQKFLLTFYHDTGRKSKGSEITDNKCIHYHLKEVEICGFSDRFNCTEFAIYLLDNAVALKRMLINSQRRNYYGVDKWIYNKVIPNELNLELTRDLLQKHNVDSKVEVIVI